MSYLEYVEYEFYESIALVVAFGVMSIPAMVAGMYRNLKERRKFKLLLEDLEDES